MSTVDKAHSAICRRFGVEPVAPDLGDKLGIARNVRDGIQPLNGMRYYPEGGTCGWYVWARGNPSQDDDFFVPLHVAHRQGRSAGRSLTALDEPAGWGSVGRVLRPLLSKWMPQTPAHLWDIADRCVGHNGNCTSSGDMPPATTTAATPTRSSGESRHDSRAGPGAR